MAERSVSEARQGLLAAILSSVVGGTSIVATRYLAPQMDPITIGIVRFLGGSLLILPLAWLQRRPLPARSDWPAIVGLGILFFSVFPILFNASLALTTAARGALALSTLPLLTMVVAAAVGREAMTWRKFAGVAIAMGGVAVSLRLNLAASPAGAWRGDLLMMAAAFCMALYSALSGPLIRRCGAVPFVTSGMAFGALGLVLASMASGGPRALSIDAGIVLAGLYLAVFGAALTFLLWAFALGKSSPTLVALSVTLNPIAAGLTGVLVLGEALDENLAIGLVTVMAGIAIAVTGKSSSGSSADAV